jgi:hypothetical protein
MEGQRFGVIFGYPSFFPCVLRVLEHEVVGVMDFCARGIVLEGLWNHQF